IRILARAGTLLFLKMNWVPVATSKIRAMAGPSSSLMKMTDIGKEKALMAERHSCFQIRFFGSLLLLGMLTLAVLTSFPVSAQKPKENPLAPKAPVAAAPQPAQPQKAAAAELTASDVEAFLDGVMPLQLAREDVAGAVISVVKDG